MRIVSAAIGAAIAIGTFAISAGPTLAASGTASSIVQIDNGWEGGSWNGNQRRHHRRHDWGGGGGHGRHGWNHDRHRQWGYYQPNRRCRTEWVMSFGPYGAQWVPVQRCYRGW